MTLKLSRLLKPQSVAVIGGGDWCSDVIRQLLHIGFAGNIWPVHPVKKTVFGRPAFQSVTDLPAAPDAAFAGINRDATVGVVAQLAHAGAGGTVCFASGFAEVQDGADLQGRLLDAAGSMPILGPNCYGFVNALDRAALWPDQHGLLPVERGVAILTQSSNIAINLTMQARGLPVGMVITAGNQAQQSQAAIALDLLEDPRITAIGLHIEGFGDLRMWERLAAAAHTKGIPLIAVKVGKSQEARAATVTHTASLAGSDAGSEALLRRLGIARVDDLAVFLETLKLAHVTGPLASHKITTVSCSGGEASLAADLALARGLTFPPLTGPQKKALSAALGPKVSLGNPLDYHTYVWRNTKAMAQVFAAACDPGVACTLLIVDFPRSDRCDPGDWECAVAAAVQARQQTGLPLAMVASLPELMPEDVAARLITANIVPMCGLESALSAVAALQKPKSALPPQVLMGHPSNGMTLTEVQAKAMLADHGVLVPKTAPFDQAQTLQPPLVLKDARVAHKTEADAVRLGLTLADLPAAMAHMPTDAYLIEEMITDPVAEVLVGVTLDPTCGFMLTLGTGGVFTEIWQDTTHLLLPVTAADVAEALSQLKIAPILNGYRGKPAADMGQIIRAVMAVQDFVIAQAARLQEVEINPLICTQTAAIAADALIRIADD